MGESKIKLREIVNQDDIRKISITPRQDSVEKLCEVLKEKLELKFNFKLQYQHVDFNNELCNLTDITELPEKATLKVVNQSFPDFSSVGTSDTEIMSVASSERQN
ncbi:UNVERIFIED_CONTAM: hypothetical protein FKN15_045592 [Acipenser sinensis]